MKNKIICSYNNNSPFGFGDFLRGCLSTKAECNTEGFDFDFDFSKHEIGNYISSNYKGGEYKEEQINNWATRKELYDKTCKEKYICTNFFPFGNPKFSVANALDIFAKSISKSDLKYFKENIIFSDKVVNELESRLRSNNISSYKVIHARTGDQNSFTEDGLTIGDESQQVSVYWEYSEPRLLNSIISWFERFPKDENLVFISDNAQLKKKIKDYIEEKSIKNMFVLTGDPSHTSRLMLNNLYQKPVILDLFETAIDLYLLSKSKQNISVSSYSFCSNFTHWVSLIFGIEYIPLNIRGGYLTGKN